MTASAPFGSWYHRIWVRCRGKITTHSPTPRLSPQAEQNPRADDAIVWSICSDNQLEHLYHKHPHSRNTVTVQSDTKCFHSVFTVVRVWQTKIHLIFKSFEFRKTVPDHVFITAYKATHTEIVLNKPTEFWVADETPFIYLNPSTLWYSTPYWRQWVVECDTVH